MNSHPTLVSWAVDLLLNLTLLGASLAVGVTIAFRFIPTSLPRARYFITVAAFCAASLLPILATMGVTTKPPASLTLPAAASRTTAANHASLIDLPPATEAAWTAPAGFRHWVPDFARRLNERPLAAVLLWLWLSVSTLLLGRELIGHLSLWRSRRKWQLATATLQQELNWPRNIPLYLHQHSGPSTVGWLRPAVVLPQRLLSDLPPTTISQVLQHELAHARWRDPLANALVRFMRALLWPSLPLWFLEHLTYTEREAAADQAAIADCAAQPEPQQSALDYAASLVSIAEWKHASAARSFNLLGTHVGGRKVLEHRVSRLLNASPRLTPARLALGVMALLGGFVGTGWLPVAIADHPVKRDGRAKLAEAPQSQIQATALARITGPAIKPLPEESAKMPGATAKLKASNREKSPERQSEPDEPYSRVIIERDGSTTFISQTSLGTIEEPILRLRQAEIEAFAIQRVIPPDPQNIVSESETPGVMVHVVVDESGKVILAWALGNDRPFIKQKAVEAARQWKFTPMMLAGRPTKVVGTLAFFGTPDWSKEWYAIRTTSTNQQW